MYIVNCLLLPKLPLCFGESLIKFMDISACKFFIQYRGASGRIREKRGSATALGRKPPKDSNLTI